MQWNDQARMCLVSLQIEIFHFISWFNECTAVHFVKCNKQKTRNKLLTEFDLLLLLYLLYRRWKVCPGRDGGKLDLLETSGASRLYLHSTDPSDWSVIWHIYTGGIMGARQKKVDGTEDALNKNDISKEKFCVSYVVCHW